MHSFLWTQLRDIVTRYNVWGTWALADSSTLSLSATYLASFVNHLSLVSVFDVFDVMLLDLTRHVYQLPRCCVLLRFLFAMEFDGTKCLCMMIGVVGSVV